MGKGFLFWILGYAKYAVLVGLVLLGLAIYAIYKADHGGGIPPESQLVTVSGLVKSASEVTVERKRRRGGKTETKYYELEFVPDTAGAAPLKLRVDIETPRDNIADIVEEKISASYDPEDSVNMVYAIKMGDKVELAYADMARVLQARADKAKAADASAGSIGFGVVLLLIGVGGMVLRRKLAAGESAAG